MKKVLVALGVFLFNFLTFILAELLVIALLLGIRLEPGNRQILLPIANALHPFRFILPLLWGLVGAWVAYRWMVGKERSAYYEKMNDLVNEMDAIKTNLSYRLSTRSIPIEKALEQTKVLVSLGAELLRLARVGPNGSTTFLDTMGSNITARSTAPHPTPPAGPSPRTD